MLVLVDLKINPPFQKKKKKKGEKRKEERKKVGFEKY
jgi:hypothetical protein